MSIRYLPYDDRTQTDRQIERYPKSFTRVPAQPLIERPLTLSELTGPVDLLSGEHSIDLTRPVKGSGRALGQLISVTGRLTDEDGRPVAGAVVELWQANAAGKYVHEIDRHNAPYDPSFTGQGKL